MAARLKIGKFMKKILIFITFVFNLCANEIDNTYESLTRSEEEAILGKSLLKAINIEQQPKKKIRKPLISNSPMVQPKKDTLIRVNGYPIIHNEQPNLINFNRYLLSQKLGIVISALLYEDTSYLNRPNQDIKVTTQNFKDLFERIRNKKFNTFITACPWVNVNCAMMLFEGGNLDLFNQRLNSYQGTSNDYLKYADIDGHTILVNNANFLDLLARVVHNGQNSFFTQSFFNKLHKKRSTASVSVFHLPTDLLEEDERCDEEVKDIFKQKR
jgi:hypothetical protein